MRKFGTSKILKRIAAGAELGAINYVGNIEYTAGLAAGDYLGAAGAKNVPCVNTVPGAALAIRQGGRTGRVLLGTFNTDPTSLERITAGTQSFAIDQQGYLQGFLAVFLLDSYIEYGMASPTQPILSGPRIVDASNVEATRIGVAKRVR